MEEQNLEHAAVVRLQPGDVVLFRSPKTFHVEQRAAVVAMLNEVFPNHESIILEGGQEIAVLRPKAGFMSKLRRAGWVA